MTESAVTVLSDVRDYIKRLSGEEADKVRAHITYVKKGELSVVYTKQPPALSVS